MFLDILKKELADKGLDLCLNKTESITTSRNHMVPLTAFENYEINETGTFKVLGAPFDSADYCNAHTEKSGQSNQGIGTSARDGGQTGSSPHSQRLFVLLQVSYATRVVPPNLHQVALSKFNAALRSTLTHIAGNKALDDEAWAQAQLGIKKGGLGLRDPVAHAAAAYIASVRSVKDMCPKINILIIKIHETFWGSN